MEISKSYQVKPSVGFRAPDFQEKLITQGIMLGGILCFLISPFTNAQSGLNMDRSEEGNDQFNPWRGRLGRNPEARVLCAVSWKPAVLSPRGRLLRGLPALWLSACTGHHSRPAPAPCTSSPKPPPTAAPQEAHCHPDL